MSNLASSCQSGLGQKKFQEIIYFGYFGNIRNIILWVADGFDVYRLGLLINRFPKFFRVVGFHPLHANAEFLQEHYEVRSLARTRIFGAQN